jgi:hypothetical protein
MSAITDYFKLSPSPSISPRAANDSPTFAASIPQYIALLLGVLLQPFYDAMRAGTQPAGPTIASVAMAVIVAAMIFPAVYKAAWDPNRPRFVQYCSIFVAGIGWQSLIETATGQRSDPACSDASAVARDDAVHRLTTNGLTAARQFTRTDLRRPVVGAFAFTNAGAICHVTVWPSSLAIPIASSISPCGTRSASARSTR